MLPYGGIIAFFHILGFIIWFYIVIPYGGIIALFHIMVRASGFGSASLQGVNEALAKCKLLAKMSRGWKLRSELRNEDLVGRVA